MITRLPNTTLAERDATDWFEAHAWTAPYVTTRGQFRVELDGWPEGTRTLDAQVRTGDAADRLAIVKQVGVTVDASGKGLVDFDLVAFEKGVRTALWLRSNGADASVGLTTKLIDHYPAARRAPPLRYAKVGDDFVSTLVAGPQRELSGSRVYFGPNQRRVVRLDASGVLGDDEHFHDLESPPVSEQPSSATASDLAEDYAADRQDLYVTVQTGAATGVEAIVALPVSTATGEWTAYLPVVVVDKPRVV